MAIFLSYIHFLSILFLIHLISVIFILFYLLHNNKRRLAAHLMVIIIFIFVFIFCLSYIYLRFILFYLYLHVDWWPIWWTSLFLQRAMFFVRNSSALFVWISKTASYIDSTWVSKELLTDQSKIDLVPKSFISFKISPVSHLASTVTRECQMCD